MLSLEQDPRIGGKTFTSSATTFNSFSLPRWISFWTIGWQISATKYAEEIEDIFNQMTLLRREIGLKMPGNKLYTDCYLETVWYLVSGVTGAIERHDDASPWLIAKYEDFVKSQENTLRTRLETISYDVDALETVHLIIGQQNIETVSVVTLFAYSEPEPFCRSSSPSSHSFCVITLPNSTCACRSTFPSKN